jgi:hypothetical protein
MCHLMIGKRFDLWRIEKQSNRLYFFDLDIEKFNCMLFKMYIIRFRPDEIKGKKET